MKDLAQKRHDHGGRDPRDGFCPRSIDRVVFMDFGEILEEGVPSEFFLNPQHERTQQFLKQVLSPMH